MSLLGITGVVVRSTGTLLDYRFCCNFHCSCRLTLYSTLTGDNLVRFILSVVTVVASVMIYVLVIIIYAEVFISVTVTIVCSILFGVTILSYS